jgi:predicted nucleotidyltransferase component of viral defense system
MDLNEIRRTSIVALFSDDILFERIVLKGGNAMSLVYQLGSRASLDLDFSIDGDFSDVEDARDRIFKTLRGRFSTAGYRLFDERFDPKPMVVNKKKGDRWGGYIVEFKLIEQELHEKLGGDIESVRRQALVTGPLQKKIFRIELSKYEFCREKAEVDLDDYTIRVYTPEMLAIEKLRALCQQLPEYSSRTHKTARARDFYDIYVLVTEAGVQINEAIGPLLSEVFAAKDVPVALLRELRSSKEFHKMDWPAVQDSVSTKVEDFDTYFKFVIDQVESLKSLWEE